MRLVTMEVSGSQRPGIVMGEDILDLVASAALLSAARLVPGDMLGILQAGAAGLDLVREIASQAAKDTPCLRACGALIPRKAVKLAAPLPNPGMVLSIGANYYDHLKEMNTPPPATPLAFYKSVASIIGSGDKILPPPGHGAMLDWECEFSFVIGKPCHRVLAADALDYVAGYTIVNDVSARDWVAPSFAAQGMMPTIIGWEHNILGKLFPTFCPMGPELVTADEISDPHNLNLEARLNGKVMQSANTSGLVFNVVQIIEYYSKFLQFRPGDVITTGSPAGVGYGRNPKVFMQPGDVIEMEIEGIGVLRNEIGKAAR